MLSRTMMLTGLLLTLAGWTGARSFAAQTGGLLPQCSRTLPLTAEQSLLVCATKALSPGDPWHLRPWQRDGYKAALKGETRTLRLWITQYWPGEGYDSRHTASGAPASLRVAAANRIARGSYVWILQPPHLRQVLDCGAHSNDRVADRRGCAAWLDLWVPRPGWRGLDSYTGAAVVFGK